MTYEEAFAEAERLQNASRAAYEEWKTSNPFEEWQTKQKAEGKSSHFLLWEDEFRKLGYEGYYGVKRESRLGAYATKQKDGSVVWWPSGVYCAGVWLKPTPATEEDLNATDWKVLGWTVD